MKALYAAPVALALAVPACAVASGQSPAESGYEGEGGSANGSSGVGASDGAGGEFSSYDSASSSSTYASSSTYSSSSTYASGSTGAGGDPGGGGEGGDGQSGGGGATCEGGGPASCDAPACGCTALGLVPLTDMGAGKYQGEEGGLYGGGSNVPPAAHAAAGLEIAKAIEPLSANGAPSATGKYVLLSIGMSNTTLEFAAFLPLAAADQEKDPNLVIVDGAVGAKDATTFANPQDGVWSTVNQRLQQKNVTAKQVTIAWVKQAVAGPKGTFQASATELEGHLRKIAQNLRTKYPNLKLAYFSSRTYAGYHDPAVLLNPEPYAYESGYAVQWLVREQIEGGAELSFDPPSGTPKAPWLAWGPYLWADGLNPRCDGVTWKCADFDDDGTHPDPQTGVPKVAAMLHDFFRHDVTAREWYLKSP